jgi:hypothetical protein
LELAIPASKISALSSGEFVGMVADNPEAKIELKAFCSEIINDHNSIKEEQGRYKSLPFVSNVNDQTVLNNYVEVKNDVNKIVKSELERMMDTPELNELLVRK